MRIKSGSTKTKGFTLIEMVIIIAILAIIAVIAVPNVSGYLEQGKITKATTDAASLSSAINILNTTLGTPVESIAGFGTAGELRQELINRNLLPKLSASTFEDALKNVVWDSATRLFDAKTSFSDADLVGY